MNKKDPWQFPNPVQQLAQEIDRLFDELIHRPWGSGRGQEEWPQLDLYETATAFILEVDLPGIKKLDVTVEVEGDDLVLQGSRADEHVHRKGNVYHHERRSGQFVRRLRLPASVDRTQIRAEFRNGVLRVTLPKLTPERQKPA